MQAVVVDRRLVDQQRTEAAPTLRRTEAGPFQLHTVAPQVGLGLDPAHLERQPGHGEFKESFGRKIQTAFGRFAFHCHVAGDAAHGDAHLGLHLTAALTHVAHLDIGQFHRGVGRGEVIDGRVLTFLRRRGGDGLGFILHQEQQDLFELLSLVVGHLDAHRVDRLGFVVERLRRHQL